MLATLRDTGFITYGNERVGAANTALIVTGGAPGRRRRQPGSTVARFAAGLAPHGSGTVLVGRDGSASGTAAVAVTEVRRRAEPAVATVDDIDSESGRITRCWPWATWPPAANPVSTASARAPRR